ncbi:YbhN family protein [Catenuloplanes sp. NPDC051500]|uniref:YbhN family protein n=1 Tax=Catenuloplanes sp. NPDC051500 TaxID=3363959 RepID=UPI0037A8B892
MSEITVVPGKSATWRSRWVRLAAVAVSVALLAVIGLRGKLPDSRAFTDALGGAHWGWIMGAAVLQAMSLACFAFQERHLMTAMGASIRKRRLFAIILARNAISISVPAGPAVSTGYAIREYSRAGVPSEIGTVCAIVSGLASIGGLTLLYAGGGAVLLTHNSATTLNWRPLAVVAALVLLIAAAVALGRRRRPSPGLLDRVPPSGRVARYAHGLLLTARAAWHAGAGLRVRDWAAVVGYSAVNRLTDLLCLIACTRALGLQINLITLATIYLGVQIVRQVPLTPGGIGVIETALVAGLTTAGATAITATAAVLIYRVISCWLLIPAGGIAALAIRRQ